MWLYLSGSDPSPTAKSTPTVRECCSHECQWVKLKEPQSGTILGLLMGKRSGGSLILSTEGFRARTSVLQDAEKAWQESEADYIGRSTGYVWRSAQGSYFSKTYQLSLFEEEQPSWTRLPRSGMTVDGQCYRLKRWARRIRERWFLLAHSKSCRDRESFGKEKGRSIPKSRDSVEPNVASNSTILRCNKGAGEGIRSEGQGQVRDAVQASALY